MYSIIRTTEFHSQQKTLHTFPRTISQTLIPKLHQSTSKEYPFALFIYVAKISGATIEIMTFTRK